MRLPRLTVRCLMILVAVVGLFLAGGMFLVRCIRVRDYAQRRVAELEIDVDVATISIEDYKLDRQKTTEDIQMWEADLIKSKDMKEEFEHLFRHPWHSIPFGEKIGRTQYEQLSINRCGTR